MDLDYSWVSLQFALSKQHNVVITIANPHMQPVSSQSVIHKTHVIRSHRFSPGFLKQMVVHPEMTALQYGNVSEPLQCFTQIIPGQNAHSLLLSFLPLLPHFLSFLLFTRALPSCTDLLIISVHTQRVLPERIFLPAITQILKAQPNPVTTVTLSAHTCLTHKHFLLPFCLSLSHVPFTLHLEAEHLVLNSPCNILP